MLALAAALGLAAGCAGAASTTLSTGYCSPGHELSAEQKDVLLRFGAVVKEELERSGAALALIARSGIDLGRFGVRYSHAGLSLRASPETPWAVRQLYYACDEKLPRLFDQGMAAFLMGGDDPSIGYVSIVLLPPDEAADVERMALENRQALQLLGATYSANAYPFSPQYQNCNQWVVELLAAAWGAAGPPATASDSWSSATPSSLRARAQGWLQVAGYAPTRFDVGNPFLLWLSGFSPWLHQDDHPAEDLDRNVYRVSMPAAIESFVRARLPGAQRIELCHDSRQVVVRHGWTSIADGCRPGEGDLVRPLP